MSWLGRWLGRVAAAEGEARGDPVRVAQVRGVLAAIEPQVAADGGRIELVSVEGGWIHVRFLGACAHCHSSDQTLRAVLEPRLRAKLPWFQGLRAS